MNQAAPPIGLVHTAWGGSTIEQWLDNIKRGYSDRFGAIFREHGCTHVSDVLNLDGSEVDDINSRVKAIPGILFSTKRRIRGALRDLGKLSGGSSGVAEIEGNDYGDGMEKNDDDDDEGEGVDEEPAVRFEDDETIDQ